MTADEMRAALMSALADVPELDAEFVADRILPTVRGIVAAELRAAAGGAFRTASGMNVVEATDLRARADVMDPTS